MFPKSTLLVSLLFLIACISCNSDENAGSFKINGFVIYNDEAADQVNVMVDDKFNLSATTDSTGYFEITGVPQGDHVLTFNKTFVEDDESAIFSEKSINVSINEDTEINEVRLPKGVELFDIVVIDITQAEISWSATDDPEFREYKLYRHDSSGLDETTGTLIHVSTSLEDTSFIDEDLNPFQTYYYRVYVMDDFGRIGGSNIVSFTTDNIELIQNGGFEDVQSNGDPEIWTLIQNDLNEPGNSIVLSDEAFEGVNSIKFHHDSDTGCWEQWIYQPVDNNLYTAGATYRMSLAYKGNFTEDVIMSLFLRNSTIDIWFPIDMAFDANGGWQELSFEFAMPDDIGNNAISTNFHFCLQGIKDWWIDDIQIERID
ncbi:MAG: hypothetical protein WBN59_09895 [Flavobacteriaceae bacterium]